ncbi:MAG: ERF family protein [Anaerolineales bacterium]
MEQSESIANLAAALSKAQAEMPPALMNKTNPFLKNRFADLGSVIDASRDVLSQNGLSMAQFPTSGTGSIGLTTMLMHESGEWLRETIVLALGSEKGKSDAQLAGSTITYLRRYAWSAVLGMYADEDTDGHSPQSSRKPEPPTAKAIAMYASLKARADSLGVIPPLEDANEADSLDELRDAYKMLKAAVDIAEKQIDG